MSEIPRGDPSEEVVQQVLRAYLDCNSELQAVIRERVEIVRSPKLVDDDHRLATETIMAILFPGGSPPEPVERRPEPTPPPAGNSEATNLNRVRDNALHGLKLGILVQGEEARYQATERNAHYYPNSNRTAIVLDIVLQQEKPTPAPPPAITGEDVARWLNVPVGALRNTPRLVDDDVVGRIQQILAKRIAVLEMALGAMATRGGDLLTENNALWQDNINALVVVSEITAQLEHVPCMSVDCDGPEDGEPATKDCPSPTRCHRCEAVRLARSVV